MAWIYYRASPNFWHVGYVRGDSVQCVREHPTEEDARADVHYLNGGTEVDMERIVETLRDIAASIWQQRGGK